MQQLLLQQQTSRKSVPSRNAAGSYSVSLAGLALADAHGIFFARLKLILRARKLSQAALAKKLEVNRSTVSRWFADEVKAEPNLETIGKIADALKVSPADLFMDSASVPGEVEPPSEKDRALYALEVVRSKIIKDG